MAASVGGVFNINAYCICAYGSVGSEDQAELWQIRSTIVEQGAFVLAMEESEGRQHVGGLRSNEQ